MRESINPRLFIYWENRNCIDKTEQEKKKREQDQNLSPPNNQQAQWYRESLSPYKLKIHAIQQISKRG